MAILAATYDVTRAILASTNRSLVQNIFNTIRSSGGEYVARKQHCQFLGYLRVDERRGQPMGGNEVVPSIGLADAQRTLLWGLQREIDEFNQRCASHLASEQPGVSVALNPYSALSYRIPGNVSRTDFLPRTAVSALEAAFPDHRALHVARETHGRVGINLPSETINSLVIGLIDGIEKLNVLDAPEELLDAFHKAPRESDARILLRYIASIASIRSTIANLDQIIFQAFLKDKLVVLNETNIFDIVDRTLNIVGGAVVLDCASDRAVILSEPGELVLVKLDGVLPPLGLCRIVKSIWRSASETGNTCTLQMRELDDDLNPYNGLQRTL